MTSFAALALAALAAGAPPAAPADHTPAVYADYGHPEVTADNCQAKDPGHTICYIPGKTAGRYLVEAQGTSTAKGPDATQTLMLGGAGWACNRAVTTRKGDWTSGARTLQVACVINVLSDAPLAVEAVYTDADATRDPKGPVVTIRPLPWSGVLDVTGFQVGVAAPKGAAPK